MRRINLRLLTIVLTLFALGISMTSARPPGGPGGGGGGGDNGPSYWIVGLDSADGLLEGWPQAINGQNLIVGYVAVPDGDVTAACWTVSESGGTVTSTLHLLVGENATGANDSGEIVGNADGKAVYWPNREADPIVLPIPEGYVGSVAEAIDAEGLICGVLSEDGISPSDAAVWRINLTTVNNQPVINLWGPVILPAPAGTTQTSALDLTDLNDDGNALVIGMSNAGAVVTTWLVNAQPDGSVSVAPVPAVVDVQANALAVNNSDQICGSRSASDSFSPATVWAPETTYSLNSGGITDGGFTACDISNDGVVVGNGFWIGKGGRLSHKALTWYTPTSSMVLLDSFLKRSSFSELTSANGVNDTGRIVGTGWDADLQINRGYMAIPK